MPLFENGYQYTMLKKVLLPFILLSFVLISCSNDFELFTEREVIPVVYGLLSKADTTQYIRIERAFLDENRSAFLVAGEPDSVYFADIRPVLIDPQTNEEFELERVNLTEKGLIRDEGFFPADPNYVYSIDSEAINLKGGEVYVLEVFQGDELLARSDARVIPDLILRTPTSLQTSLNLQGPARRTFRWDQATGAEFYNLRFFITYDERDAENGGDFESQMLVWNVASRTENNIVRVSGDEFLEFLGNAIEENPSVLRRFRTINIRIDAGGEELANYVNVALANTGITAAQEIPVYTNIEGGLGLFSSVNHLVSPDYILSSQAIDSLINGRFTANLNFVR